ncbi:hypothetical protein Q7P37_002825 [Cladosporium fusiforme]
MGDQPARVNHTPLDAKTPESTQKRTEHLPFHAQLDNLAQTRTTASQQMDGNAARSFDLRQMANALPPSNQSQLSMEGRRPSAPYAVPAPAGMMGTGPYQYNGPAPQYGQQRPDPAAFARAQQYQQQQQQQCLPHNFAASPGQYHMANRPQPAQLQTQHSYPHVDPYAYGAAQPAYSPVDMRYAQPPFPVSYGAPGGYADMGQFPRRDSEPAAAIPSFPRGPPRKPKQSGHALWVGNLPPAATVTDLKDHFSRDATTDIQSLFLISKSNCAFVNYRTEAACVAAMNRFHDSRFHGVRLVCRLRRGSANTTKTTSVAENAPSAADSTPDGIDGVAGNEISDPVIVGGVSQAQHKVAPETISPAESATAIKVPEKFFIVKSLTLQDLEASVRNGIWATQSHNETTLNKAYAQADNVYLIFSANKSGEYFGYARMASPISGDPVPISSAPAAQSPVRPTTSDGPKSIPTPATQTAPRGRIIDDSARGTIFWEAELSDDDGTASPEKEVEESNGGQDLGRPFKVEWVSTARLPFYRTRGLRNSWNANREVKIARDGTELEPSIGKRLVQMFHRPAQMVPGAMPPGAIPYPMA